MSDTNPDDVVVEIEKAVEPLVEVTPAPAQPEPEKALVELLYNDDGEVIAAIPMDDVIDFDDTLDDMLSDDELYPSPAPNILPPDSYALLCRANIPLPDRIHLESRLNCHYREAVAAAQFVSDMGGDVAAVLMEWEQQKQAIVDAVTTAESLHLEGMGTWRQKEAARLAQGNKDRRQQYLVERMGEHYIDARLEQCTTETDDQKTALEDIANWAGSLDARNASPFLLMSGPPQIGKTHFACGAFFKFEEQGIQRSYWREYDLHKQWMECTWSDRKSDDYQSPDDLIALLQGVYVLIIDDVGKTKMTEAWGAFLYQIIDWRLANNKPTLLTSNWRPDELQQRGWEASLVARLNAAYKLPMTGKSRRGKA